MSFLKRILFVLPLALVPSLSWGQTIDLSGAVLVVRGDAPALSTVATVLAEEVNRRTGLDWQRAAEVPPGRACIEIALSADGGPGPEGFSLNASPAGRIELVGADAPRRPVRRGLPAAEAGLEKGGGFAARAVCGNPEARSTRFAAINSATARGRTVGTLGRPSSSISTSASWRCSARTPSRTSRFRTTSKARTSNSAGAI